MTAIPTNALSNVRRIPSARLTSGLLIGGAVAVNAAFLGLGAVFDYPAVLKKPSAEVLSTFGANSVVIGAWFLLLAIGAGLLAPIALRVGRLARSRALKASVPIGVAAAAVQVIGLLRWPLVVPALARSNDPQAVDTFHTLNVLLGNVIGETIGYALTAAWTILVAVGLRHTLLRRPLVITGIVAAALIATGTMAVIDVPGAALANFAGYVIWSLWLVTVAQLVLRRPAYRA